jgi:hypothetical protein
VSGGQQENEVKSELHAQQLVNCDDGHRSPNISEDQSREGAVGCNQRHNTKWKSALQAAQTPFWGVVDVRGDTTGREGGHPSMKVAESFGHATGFASHVLHCSLEFGRKHGSRCRIPLIQSTPQTDSDAIDKTRPCWQSKNGEWVQHVEKIA